ncbi:hypothetical protein [uncultured Clostridium sp.]|uniref:hypothetical protein n=1 Tax=uncultured Clostridium sp. TaxID=59620 RepID=UPI0026395736|nr:hypothetical protein [uncultured Clostridium sp.]
MEKERIVKTEVKIEGIADQGYGFTYQYINRSKELTIEAKEIYNYLSGFAGKGHEAFPSVSLMLAELGISKTRFYKHRELLLEKGLIRVEQGRFKYKNQNREYLDTCLYILLTDYEKIEEQKEKYKLEKDQKDVKKSNVKQRHIKKQGNVEPTENTNVDEIPQNEDTQNEDTQNKDINNNNSNNNNFNNNNITTTKEKDNTKKNNSSSININLDIKGITKTNIKRLNLNQEQIDLLENYVAISEYENLDKFCYYIAKQIKNELITEKDLAISKKVSKKKKGTGLSPYFEKDKEYYQKAAKEFEEEAFNWDL